MKKLTAFQYSYSGLAYITPAEILPGTAGPMTAPDY